MDLKDPGQLLYILKDFPGGNEFGRGVQGSMSGWRGLESRAKCFVPMLPPCQQQLTTHPMVHQTPRLVDSRVFDYQRSDSDQAKEQTSSGLRDRSDLDRRNRAILLMVARMFWLDSDYQKQGKRWCSSIEQGCLSRLVATFRFDLHGFECSSSTNIESNGTVVLDLR